MVLPFTEKDFTLTSRKGGSLTISRNQYHGQISPPFHKKNFFAFLLLKFKHLPFVSLEFCLLALVDYQRHSAVNISDDATNPSRTVVPHGRFWPAKAICSVKGASKELLDQ